MFEDQARAAAAATDDSESAKEEHAPGMKSNTVRGTTILSHACVPEGHHNT